MFLVLIWVGFVGDHFEVCAEGGGMGDQNYPLPKTR